MAVVLLTVFLLGSSATAQTNPPGSGDWDIYDTTTISGQRVTITGSVRVYNGGSLTLTNVDLIINGASSGAERISIRTSGTFKMTGGSISASSSSHHYRFEILDRAIVTMDTVTVKNMWQSGERYTTSPPTSLRGGMQIYSDTVTLSNCTITDNDRIAITVIRASPLIQNCTLQRSAYFSTNTQDDYYYGNLWRDAFGILSIDATPKIYGCNIREMGDYSTAFTDWYQGGRYGTYLHLMGYAVYVYQGAPQIKDTLIAENGRVHTSSYWYGYVEGRYVRFRFTSSYTKGLIWADNPMSLEIKGCEFTLNYPGYYYSHSNSHAIFVDDGRVIVSDSRFLTNEGNGVGAITGDLTVQYCTFWNLKYKAINLMNNGDYTIERCTMNGTGETRTPRYEIAVYVNNVGPDTIIRHLNVSFMARAFEVYYSAKVEIKHTVITNTTKKLYVDGSRVDCFNVTIARGEIELSRWSQNEVNLRWSLDILVTWQNNRPIAGAVVQIFNESQGLLIAKQTVQSGRLETIPMLQTKLVGSSQDYTATTNNPLMVSAFANGTQSDMHTFPFVNNTFFHCIIHDRSPPNVVVYFPKSNHAQNTTGLEILGMAIDKGSGLLRVEVSTDGENWLRASGGRSWRITLILEEGVYDVFVKGLDRGGSHSIMTIENVTIDLTAPWLVVTQPKEKFLYTNSTSVTVIGQAEIGAEVYLNGEELSTQGGQFFTQLSFPTEGLHSYELMAIDPVGNRNVTNLRIYQDITAPILLVEHPPEDHVTNERVLAISGLTEIDVAVTINDVPIEVEMGLFTLSMTLEEGLNIIEIHAVDLAHNHRWVVREVRYDITPPTVIMEYPTRDEASNRSNVVVRGSFDPDVALVRVNQVLVPFSENSFSKNFKLDEGPNLIVIEVTDQAGNSITKRFTITLDTEPPELVVESPPPSSYASDETISVSGRVDVEAHLTINGEVVTTSGGYFRHDVALEETPPGADPNTIMVLAMDPVGNEALVVLSVVRDTQPPGLTVHGMPRAVVHDYINITGRIHNIEDLALLTINDVPVKPKDDGYFEAFVGLEMGNNTFVVRAADQAGNEDIVSVNIDRTKLSVSDSGILGLGDWTWLLLLLFLGIGLAIAFGVLYLLERKEVVG
jgi:hypothetical protein